MAEFYNGTNAFILPNGDAYLGEYCAHVSGVIWREGHGVYHTADGQFYEGRWMNDKLVDGDEVRITFKDKSVYSGAIAKNKYEGPGTFTFNNGIKLFCNFSENKPIGDVMMSDGDGRLWRGVAEEDRVYLSPENIFFNNIPKHRGKSKKTLAQLEPDWKTPPIAQPSRPEKTPSVNWEDVVFAKSTKTDATCDYTSSPWYRKFADYKNNRAAILKKVQTHQPLSKPESAWYTNYAKYKRRIKVEKLRTRVDTSLLDRFFSKEFAESCKPYTVIYPNLQTEPEQISVDTEDVAVEIEKLDEEEEIGIVLQEEEEQRGAFEEDVVSVEKAEPPGVGLDTASLYLFLDAIHGKRKFK